MDSGLIEIEDFLNDFPKFREYLDTVDYKGVVNPEDGVLYPGISLDIPPDVQHEIASKIEVVTECTNINAMFLRLSVDGVDAPHHVHNDTRMGAGSLILYLNRAKDCQGGTSFVTHENGMDLDPRDDEEVKAWEQDTKNYEKWTITDICQMRPNKAVFFDSNRMHRAEPVSGFGECPVNGRLVLVSFFDD